MSALGACASTSSPDRPEGADLAGFIARGPAEDLATVAAADLSALPPSDLAGPHDLAASFPDQATPHDFAAHPPDFSHPPDLSHPPDMAQAGCGNVTSAGTCDGNTRRYCSGNAVQTESCSGGKSCTTQSGNAVCTYVPYTPCNGVSRPGFCYQNAMVWCDVDGTLRVVSCGGFTCHNVGGSTECS